ncbi:E3 ubiquitin-protein ligase TRIM39-like isoform X2 [Pleurodeles waltl]|uniref:E3 ubiquitin-protein ligase TRIM39-like isoform X2 n=1 Tax=Pleurodeles waltl TaxID=8319 RepID=UPI003709B7CB
MAAPLSDLQSEVSCPVCLEYFTHPVTINCGHSYCRECITLSWGSAGGTFTCPQCRRKCTMTDLPRNLQLSNLVEIARRISQQSGDSVDLCERHREPLKLFCETDQTLVCIICDKSSEHKDHAVIPIEEVTEQNKVRFAATLVRLQNELDNIVSLQANAHKKSAEFKIKIKNERKKIETEFKELQEFLEKEKIHFLSKLEKEEKEILHLLNESITTLSEHMSSLNEMMSTIQEKRKLSLVQQLEDVKSFLSRFKSDTTEKPTQVSAELSNSIYSFTKELVLMKMSAKYSGACDVSGGPGMEELRIVLIDLTGDGTHAALNTLLGREDGLEYKSDTGECTKRSCVRDGRRLALTEWALPLDLEDIEEESPEECCKCLTFSAPGPHAILLVLNVGQTVTEGMETIAFIKRLFYNEEGLQRHGLVLFSWKEGLKGKTVNSYVQASGAALKDLIGGCGGRHCVIRSRARAEERARERSEVMALIDTVLQRGAFYTDETYQIINDKLLKSLEVVKERCNEEAKIFEKAIHRQYQDLMTDLEGEKDSAEKTKLIEDARWEMSRKLRESERKLQIKLEGAREGAEVVIALLAAEVQKNASDSE